MLASRTKLSKLSIAENMIPSVAAANGIQHLLSSSSLKALDLSGVQAFGGIREAFATALSYGLANNHNLTSLNIANFDFLHGDMGAHYALSLAHGLKENVSFLSAI